MVLKDKIQSPGLICPKCNAVNKINISWCRTCKSEVESWPEGEWILRELVPAVMQTEELVNKLRDAKFREKNPYKPFDQIKANIRLIWENQQYLKGAREFMEVVDERMKPFMLKNAKSTAKGNLIFFLILVMIPVAAFIMKADSSWQMVFWVVPLIWLPVTLRAWMRYGKLRREFAGGKK